MLIIPLRRDGSCIVKQHNFFASYIATKALAPPHRTPHPPKADGNARHRTRRSLLFWQTLASSPKARVRSLAASQLSIRNPHPGSTAAGFPSAAAGNLKRRAGWQGVETDSFPPRWLNEARIQSRRLPTRDEAQRYDGRITAN